MNNQDKRNENTSTYLELHDKLKMMKFSGMAEELRHQMEDPNADLRSFEERFNDLVEAEWLLRYNKKFDRFMKKSKIKHADASFDETLYDPKRQLDTVTIEKLSNCNWIKEGRNLLITGMTGTGKTYYANAMGIAALKQFYTVRYYSANRLMMELNSYRQMDNTIKLLEMIEEMSKVDLLIIDDFGLMELDIEKCRYLFQILDAREGRKSTMIVSQIPVKEWYDLFEDSTYADACLDRLVCKAYRLEFNGESLRKDLNK